MISPPLIPPRFFLPHAHLNPHPFCPLVRNQTDITFILYVPFLLMFKAQAER